MMHTPLCDCCCCIQWLLFRFCGSLFDFFCVMRVLSVLIQYGKLTYNISLHLMHRVLLSWYTIICVFFDSRRFYRIFFIICYPNYSVALVASIKKSGMVCTVVAIPCDLKLNWINILLVGCVSFGGSSPLLISNSGDFRVGFFLGGLATRASHSNMYHFQKVFRAWRYQLAGYVHDCQTKPRPNFWPLLARQCS